MRINPVLQKDLKTKLRGWRAPVLITCYIILLALLLLVIFAGNGMLNPYNVYGYNPRLAVDTYNILIVFQFALLFIAVPAITATSISGERERQTLDLMLVFFFGGVGIAISAIPTPPKKNTTPSTGSDDINSSIVWAMDIITFPVIIVLGWVFVTSIRSRVCLSLSPLIDVAVIAGTAIKSNAN